MNIKKSLIVLLFSFLLSATCFAVKSTVQDANRRTAVRCLKIAESYLSSGDWGNAVAQADFGLAYDDTISDLWYVKAAAKSALDEPKADVLPLVEHSLMEGEWVDYNRDAARILYADLLCDTGRGKEALSWLDQKPFIYSADAEFIRIKAYYRTGDEKSARTKINSARKIYPLDMRFPRVFFKNEYRISKENILSIKDEEQALLVKKIADSFIAKMPEYDNPDDELEIYSVIFSEGEHQKRLLQAFIAHGMEHPLYAKEALKQGLFSQQEAWDYFCTFADEQVSVEMLEDFLLYITDDITKESVCEHLESFNGTLSIDTDGDGEGNLFAKYFRGRAQFVSWDKNNDGVFEWTSECDFGVPVSLFVAEGNLNINYGTYPSILSISCNAESEDEGLLFTLQDESYDWTPIEIKPLDIARNFFGYDFFVPYPKENQELPDNAKIMQVCSFFEIPSKDRLSARIKFSVVDGVIETSDYSVDGKYYAHCVFEQGIPVLRSIDNDGDGSFETIELYGLDESMNFNSSMALDFQMAEKLFGKEMNAKKIYLKLIQIDSDFDTIPDFTEEYLMDGTVISCWDSDADGKWDVQFKKYPKKEGDSTQIEQSLFYLGQNRKLVSVINMNGEPVRVSVNIQNFDGENQLQSDSGDFNAATNENDNYVVNYDVTSGVQKGFYWIGDGESAECERFVLSNMAETENGKSRLLVYGDLKINAIQIDGKFYASVIPEFGNSFDFSSSAVENEDIQAE